MTALLALAAVAAMAHPGLVGDDWRLSLDGQIRPRFVAHAGRDFVGTDPVEQIYVSQRTRLGAVFQHDDGTALTLRLQDVRFWGEEDGTLDAAAAGLDLHEAFLALPLFEGAEVRVGRQEIAWDQQRLIGVVGWTQRARAFDALRLRWADEAADVELLATALATSANSHGPTGDADGHVDPSRTKDTFLLGTHAHARLAEGVDIAALYLLRRDGALEEKRHTAGGLISLNTARVSGRLEGYYQLGDLGEESIGAWLAGARLAWTPDAAMAPRFEVIADVVSGDGTPTGAFDTLYGTNHGYYGEADLFIALPPHTALLGLVDLGGRVSLKPRADLTLAGAFHAFTSVEPGPDDATDFGEEIDLTVDWRATERFTLAGLATLVLPGDLWTAVRGGDKAEQALFVTGDFGF
ncbi:MAG: alginate export family protein [Myxococcales bacterium]|nr:alginate export family protein [Myxococcales bacterium]MCB9546717.1 alginate export family protein [Myxococcales bacterium]